MQTQSMAGLGLIPFVAALSGLLLALVMLLLVKTLARSRERINADLQASEAMLDRAGQMAGVGGWELDLLSQQMRWSRQTCQMHDVVANFRPSLAQALAFFSDEGDRRLLSEAVQRAAAGGPPWDMELPLTTALGRVIRVRVVGEAQRSAGAAAGPFSRLVGSIQDVTAQRALEDAMRRNHSLLRSVVDHLPCGLSVYDSRLRLIVHNEQFAKGHELPPAFFEGRQPHFDELLAFNQGRGEYGEGDAAERAVARLREFGRSPHEIQFERKRPNGGAIEVRAAPMPGGGIIITSTDVTERRRAQAEQSRSEQLLRDAMDAIDEAFVLFDNEDRIVFCNEKYRSTYADVADLLQAGTTFEQIVRARIAVDPGHEARRDPAQLERWVAERVAQHQKGSTKMVRRLSDGRWLRVIEHKLPSGHIAGFRVDISDLMHATEAAEKASVAKSQFLANMSHEIRTPMNAVLGMLKLLQRTPLNAQQHDYAGKAAGAARSLLGLLNDILDFSKVEADKMTLDLQALRLDSLLRDLAVIMAANLDGKNVALRFDIDPMLPRCVIGDGLRLRQILINLTGNALKFTQAGEVRVQLRLVERQGEAISIDFVVSDTGIGIAPEHQARIFDGFTQAEASTSRRFGGTGLGLAISQRLVQLMGATLQLSSAPGRGSRFSFQLRMALPDDADQQGLFDGFLPVAPTASINPDDRLTGARMAVPWMPQRLRGLRLMVVEDNVNNQQVASELLQGEGAEVLLASDGQQALSLLASAKRDGMFDAVLMDVQMPVMDGYTATRLIRRHLRLELPIIAMTANALSADRQACQDAGMDDYVGKPFDIDLLVATLLRLCGKAAPVTAPLPGHIVLEPAPALLLQADEAGIAFGDALGRLSGKADLFVRMVDALAEEAAALPSPLLGSVGAAALHGFRGLAATLGATRLAELASQGECALQSVGELPAGWAMRFDVACRRDLLALAALARQLPLDAPVVPLGLAQPTAVLPDVTSLIGLLQASDMGALDIYAALRPTLLAEQPAQVNVLDACLGRLDFAEAISACHAVLRLRLA